MARFHPAIIAAVAAWLLASPADLAGGQDRPIVLPIRDQVTVVNQTLASRLDRLLPVAMREAGLDMWIVATNEDNYDPVFQTMVPLNTWAPITQLLVFHDPGPGKPIERLNVSRTALRGLYKDAWDASAWDTAKKESQWAALARVVGERNPKAIGLNEGDIQWAAGGLTVSLKKQLVASLGPDLSKRFVSAEAAATRWLETLLPEEIDLYSHAVALGHWAVAETMSSRAITPGVTTVDDMNFDYWQRVANLGLQYAFLPSCSIRGRSPEDAARYPAGDRVVRRGDLLHCDVGLKYLRYNTDHQEWAYVLRAGERDVPESFKRAMAQVNRLQDIYLAAFKAGLTGDEILGDILKGARLQGIDTPRIYSHSIGYYLHEPGPLIGLPWEQVHNEGRGEVKLVDHSCFTMELSADMPIPEWGGKVLRMGMEQDVAFTGGKAVVLDGRQTSFHLVR